MEMNTTIGYDILKGRDEEMIPLLKELSCYSNVYILAANVEIAEVTEYIKKLVQNRVRRPLVTDRVIGDFVKSEEELKCILSSI